MFSIQQLLGKSDRFQELLEVAGSWRIIKTPRQKMVKIHPVQGFAAGERKVSTHSN